MDAHWAGALRPGNGLRRLRALDAQRHSRALVSKSHGPGGRGVNPLLDGSCLVGTDLPGAASIRGQSLSRAAVKHVPASERRLPSKVGGKAQQVSWPMAA